MSNLFEKVHESLPIFKIDFGRNMILYTPGYSVELNDIPSNELKVILKNIERLEDTTCKEALTFIRLKSQEVVTKWNFLKELPFSPECLTIQTGNECNLNCSYCYSKDEQTNNNKLIGFPDINSINKIIEFISPFSTLSKRKLTVVFHGSGEPTYHWDKLVETQQSVSKMSAERGLDVFFYIATNGCLKEFQIDWLAENMDLIGISCDGPEAIQYNQRFSKKAMYMPIDEVCKRILSLNGKFDIRATITRETISSLVEITKYFIFDCKATNIRIEPVYLAGDYGFKDEDAEIFFKHFVDARNFADQFHIGFNYSGVRINELHGPFCESMRNTIRLTTNDITQNCFCYMFDDNFITGSFINGKIFNLSTEIDEIKKMSFLIPECCSECINIYHCSRGCPEFCIFEKETSKSVKLNTFRCRLHQLLAVDDIMSSTNNKVYEC
jgi:sulfatase maturation enzyme AslB (radical SAM superfamily)